MVGLVWDFVCGISGWYVIGAGLEVTPESLGSLKEYICQCMGAMYYLEMRDPELIIQISA